MFLFSFIFVAFVEIRPTKDAIIANTDKYLINVETSGNNGLYFDGKCVLSKGNQTLIGEENYDWTSKIAENTNDESENPFIQYSIKGKRMKIKKYAIRNGCCKSKPCITDNYGKIRQYGDCCELYSYSLQGSNDATKWNVLHKVEKEEFFDFCQVKSFNLELKQNTFKYLRFVLDHERPYSNKCLQLNQIEFYGKLLDENKQNIDDSYEMNEDEAISIIGRVRKDE